MTSKILNSKQTSLVLVVFFSPKQKPKPIFPPRGVRVWLGLANSFEFSCTLRLGSSSHQSSSSATALLLPLSLSLLNFLVWGACTHSNTALSVFFLIYEKGLAQFCKNLLFQLVPLFIFLSLMESCFIFLGGRKEERWCDCRKL